MNEDYSQANDLAGKKPGKLRELQYQWWAAAALYRLHLLRRLTITPDVQVLVNPALNPDEDVVAVFGLRARLVF